MVCLNTEVIGTCLIKGGLLVPDHTQKVIVKLLPAEEDKNEKVVVTFGITKGDEWTEPPKSLRFDSYGDFLAFRNLILQANVLLGKREGTINPDNVGFYVDKETKLIMKAYRGSEREEVVLG